jgi:hypothetical protein
MLLVNLVSLNPMIAHGIDVMAAIAAIDRQGIFMIRKGFCNMIIMHMI